MTKYLSCGQYKCRIFGNSKLYSLIPDNWDKFLQVSKSNYTVDIYLEEKIIESNNSESDGWVVQRFGFPMALYSHNGKAVVGLHYIGPHAVTVFIGKALDSYLRIGIHYGLMLALHQECIGLHGVTILCGNEVIILSAPSGTGKTTFAKLLEKYYDSIVINGDFALLSLTENKVFFEPTPFCGSSRRSLNHRFEVNRVVFLGQAKENKWSDLSGIGALKHFMGNTFIPTWDSKMKQSVQENILKCISMLKVNAYDFAPTQEAADIFIKHLSIR